MKHLPTRPLRKYLVLSDELDDVDVAIACMRAGFHRHSRGTPVRCRSNSSTKRCSCRVQLSATSAEGAKSRTWGRGQVHSSFTRGAPYTDQRAALSPRDTGLCRGLGFGFSPSPHRLRRLARIDRLEEASPDRASNLKYRAKELPFRLPSDGAALKVNKGHRLRHPDDPGRLAATQAALHACAADCDNAQFHAMIEASVPQIVPIQLAMR
eukprot:scaffold123841_cov33-Tisochrysis_lutea.AAC.2